MLRRSSYTVDAVVDRIGAPAVAALGRHESAPTRIALGDANDVQAQLIRLLLLGDDVDVSALRQLLPLDAMATLLEPAAAGRMRCAVEVAPHGDDTADWWVVSDRTDARGRPTRRDHVLGVGGASTTLAQLTVRRRVTRALDIGTGCGVQALHLSRHTTSVTATDVLPRALELAATTFALSDVDVELLAGDLTQPVADREFDLVVCNPPFVVGPHQRFDYRDAGRDADELSRAAVRAAARALADGGVAQLLVNWLHVRGEDWRDRIGDWVSDLGCDAWLIQRDLQEPADYVSTWSGDAGDYDDAVAAEWLAWLQSRGVDAIGFGWVVLRRSAAPHRVAVEEIPHPVDQPLGPHIAGWLDRVEWLRDRTDDALLDVAFVPAPDVRLDTVAAPGADGWRPVASALRLDSGWRWSLPCDDVTAAIVSGCNGSSPLRALVAVLGVITGLPEPDLIPAVCATVRGLLDRGLLLPPRPAPAAVVPR